jgi:hypothetical protein
VSPGLLLRVCVQSTRPAPPERARRKEHPSRREQSCIECLHKRIPFRFRQWIRAPRACTWRSLRMWVSAFVVRLGKYSFVHRSPDAGLGRFGRSGRSELVRINDWKRLRAGLPHVDGRMMVVDRALAYAEISGDVLAWIASHDEVEYLPLACSQTGNACRIRHPLSR